MRDAFPLCRSITHKKKAPFSNLKDASKQGYKDSNLEMTESESVALPFGDSPLSIRFSLATSGII